MYIFKCSLKQELCGRVVRKIAGARFVIFSDFFFCNSRLTCAHFFTIIRKTWLRIYIHKREVSGGESLFLQKEI